VIGRFLRLQEPAKVLTIAALALAGFALPATASAASPRTYKGTVVVDQAPVTGTLPKGSSSASYSFHASYAVTAKRVRLLRGGKVAQYIVTGRGPQALSYKVNLSDKSGSNTTHANVADWHGSGAWTKRSGNIAVLDVAGKRFGVQMDLGLSGVHPGTIPLAVSSQETDVTVTEEMTCTSKSSQSGSTLTASDSCASHNDLTVTVPVRTTINPHALLGQDPHNRVCPGTKSVVTLYNGFCGSAKGGGRIRPVYKTTTGLPLDYPFSPFEDDSAARDAMVSAGLVYASLGTWGTLVLRTTFTVDLKPGK
jgi:hypothetical protein